MRGIRVPAAAFLIMFGGCLGRPLALHVALSQLPDLACLPL